MYGSILILDKILKDGASNYTMRRFYDVAKEEFEKLEKLREVCTLTLPPWTLTGDFLPFTFAVICQTKSLVQANIPPSFKVYSI